MSSHPLEVLQHAVDDPMPIPAAIHLRRPREEKAIAGEELD